MLGVTQRPKPAQLADSGPAPVAKVGLFTRSRKRAAGVLATLAFLVAGSATAANASTPSTDPTGGAGDTFFTSLTAYLQGHLIVAVLALAVIGVAVSMLLSWGKKAAKSK
jgi:hypothetical protein